MNSNAILIDDAVDYYLSASLADQHNFQIGECYANCWRYVDRHGLDDDVRYVEGYVIDRNSLPVPIAHAWLLLPSGVILDPTLVAWSNKNGRGPSDLIYFPASVFDRQKMSRLAAAAIDYNAATLRFPLTYYSHEGDRTRYEAAGLAANLYTLFHCTDIDELRESELVYHLHTDYSDRIAELAMYYDDVESDDICL